jgi:hypothetical protein
MYNHDWETIAVYLVRILASQPLIFLKVRAGWQVGKRDQGRVTQLVLNNFFKLNFFWNLLKFPK